MQILKFQIPVGLFVVATTLMLSGGGIATATMAAAKGNKACCKAERRKCDAFCATLSKASARYPRCQRDCRRRTFNCYRTGFYFWARRPTAVCK